MIENIIQVVAATLCSFCFSILFGASRKLWLYCGLVGGLGWLVYLIVLYDSSSAVIASFAATFALTAFSRLFACWRKAPITVFLFAGIFLLVPGAGVYYTANYLFANAFEAGITKAVDTLKIAGAIVLGILIGLSLPPRLFQWASSDKPQK